MPQPSRAERRRTNRPGGTQPPKRRDPMVPVYIGLALVVVLVFIGFGVSNMWQNNARKNAEAFDMSTPTPGPAPTRKPIQLHDLQAVGKPIGFPVPDPKKGILSDTKAGGQGQPVDGIPCQATEAVQLHIHAHLSIFSNGQQVQVPPFIGIEPTNTYPGECLYWIHTHDASGIIHVEAGAMSAPEGGPFTLGNLFDIWGQPLTRTQVGPFKGDVSAFVNQQPYDGDLAKIPLRAHQRITLEVGKPVVPPPNYLLPPND
jgi:hypothetical protein